MKEYWQNVWKGFKFISIILGIVIGIAAGIGGACYLLWLFGCWLHLLLGDFGIICLCITIWGGIILRWIIKTLHNIGKDR